MTLHRPSNVDDDATLDGILGAIGDLAKRLAILFPVHPRIAARLRTRTVPSGVIAIEPLGCLDFLALTSNAAIAITDSGGLQEATTAPRDPVHYRAREHGETCHRDGGDEPGRRDGSATHSPGNPAGSCMGG
jgi:UDP-N-acetylglucosamine 2-epimerase